MPRSFKVLESSQVAFHFLSGKNLESLSTALDERTNQEGPSLARVGEEEVTIEHSLLSSNIFI